MIKVSYDHEHEALTIDFVGKVAAAQVEQFFTDIHKALPKNGKGFKLLTDLSLLEEMAPEVKESIKTAMDFFNAEGVTEIVRVIPDPSQDIGFGIMSPFHYSKEVKFLTVQTREEAQDRLKHPG